MVDQFLTVIILKKNEQKYYKWMSSRTTITIHNCELKENKEAFFNWKYSFVKSKIVEKYPIDTHFIFHWFWLLLSWKNTMQVIVDWSWNGKIPKYYRHQSTKNKWAETHILKPCIRHMCQVVFRVNLLLLLCNKNVNPSTKLSITYEIWPKYGERKN